MTLDTLIADSGGRKFLLAVLGVVASTAALISEAITAHQWLDTLPWLIGIGVGGVIAENVAQAIESVAKSRASGSVTVAAVEQGVEPAKVAQLTAASQPKAPPS